MQLQKLINMSIICRWLLYLYIGKMLTELRTNSFLTVTYILFGLSKLVADILMIYFTHFAYLDKLSVPEGLGN